MAGSIEGTLINQQNGQPVAGVSVSLQPQGGDQSSGMATSKVGRSPTDHTSRRKSIFPSIDRRSSRYASHGSPRPTAAPVHFASRCLTKMILASPSR